MGSSASTAAPSVARQQAWSREAASVKGQDFVPESGDSRLGVVAGVRLARNRDEELAELRSQRDTYVYMLEQLKGRETLGAAPDFLRPLTS